MASSEQPSRQGQPASRDLVAAARAIIDATVYLTLGTTGDDGRPWVSPVYYAASQYREFYWASPPEAAHSQNLARRPHVSLVVFDSQQPPNTGLAVYMTAVAQELAAPDVGRGLRTYPRPAERAADPLTAEDLLPPAPYRLYRATVGQYWVPCPRGPGQPCSTHGRAADHRIRVAL